MARSFYKGPLSRAQRLQTYTTILELLLGRNSIMVRLMDKILQGIYKGTFKGFL